MDDKMLALGRVAYERYVEANDGVLRMPDKRVYGLPAWTDSGKNVAGGELSDDQKEVWARVAAAITTPYSIAITDEMIDAFGSRWRAEDLRLRQEEIHDTKAMRRRAGLRAALESAGFTVVDE